MIYLDGLKRDYNCFEMGGDGCTPHEIFNNTTGYGYGDILLMPGANIDFNINEVNLDTMLTKNISMKLPFVSSPMDTVTEADMAIAMALQGGVGIIHCNNSIEDQVKNVCKLKRFNNGFIHDPVVISPDTTVDEVYKLQESSNFSGFPVTLNGCVDSKLLGMISRRDIDYIEDHSIPVSEVMTSIEHLIVGDTMSLNNQMFY